MLRTHCSLHSMVCHANTASRHAVGCLWYGDCCMDASEVSSGGGREWLCSALTITPYQFQDHHANANLRSEYGHQGSACLDAKLFRFIMEGVGNTRDCPATRVGGE